MKTPESFCSSFPRNLTEEEFSQARQIKINTNDNGEVLGRLAIDFKAAQLFFELIKQSKGVLGSQNYIQDLVGQMWQQFPSSSAVQNIDAVGEDEEE